MTDELWMEVHGIVREAVIKTIPRKKKCKKETWLSKEALPIAEKRREEKGKGKKEKWLFGEALPIAEKRREVKGKGEKERYTPLNAEFQRIARR